MADSPRFDDGSLDPVSADQYTAIGLVLEKFTGLTPQLPSNITTGYQRYIQLYNKTTMAYRYIYEWNGSDVTPTTPVISTFPRTTGDAYSYDTNSTDLGPRYVDGTLVAPSNVGYAPDSADFHVYDPDGIVYTLDGTNPSATNGIKINYGGSFTLSVTELTGDLTGGTYSYFRYNSLNTTPSTTVTGGLYVQWWRGLENYSGFED